MLLLLALAACPAPYLGAECEHGASRCVGDHVERCACPNLGGSGPFAMDICTGPYTWLSRSEGCAAQGKVCVESAGGADCAWPGGEPPAPDPWVHRSLAFVIGARAAEGQGFVAGELSCGHADELAAAREEPSLPPVSEACSVTFTRDGHEVIVSELTFADVEAAAAGVQVLRGRGDGGDPGEPCQGGCKALVSGWVEDDNVLWVTVRSAAWEADGCDVLRGYPRARRGTFACAGVDGPG